MKKADLPDTSPTRGRGTLVIPILIVLLIAPFILAAAPVQSKNSGTFEQWFNEPEDAWTNGGINGKSSYREGDVVPFRLSFKNLTVGGEYSFDVQYDALIKGVRGYDELKSFGSTETTEPCVGLSCPVSEVSSGPFTFWGAEITGVKRTPGTPSNNGSRTDTVTVTFKPEHTAPVVAWGGHLAVSGVNQDGSSFIGGAPLSMTTSVSGSLHLSAGTWLSDPVSDPSCTGSITARMVDGDTAVNGGSLSGTPAVTLNGTATSDVTCGNYDYTATAPEGWQLTGDATKTATVTDGNTTTLTWTVTQITCDGTITATMVDSDDVARTGDLTGSPTVTLNGDPTSDVTCGNYDYTATAPEGWQLTGDATKTATVTDGNTVTLTWTVEPTPLTCPAGTVPSENGTTCVQPEGPVEGGDPIVEEEEVIEEEQDPVIVEDPKDPVVKDPVVKDPVVKDDEVVCEGGLGLRVTDLLGEPVPGASVALGGETHTLTSGQHDETVPCGSVEVELTSVPGGYVFVRTELHGTSTLSAQSTHTKSQKVSAVVSDDGSSTVVFVVDPLEVMPEEITEPAPERNPLGAPNPAPAPDDPQPAPQPAPVEPVAAPTLPRTGIPAGRLLTLAILLLTAGSAMLGSRRSVDR